MLGIVAGCVGLIVTAIFIITNIIAYRREKRMMVELEKTHPRLETISSAADQKKGNPVDRMCNV